MHNAWRWNNAVDVPRCARTVVLWLGSARLSPALPEPADEWRAWRMSRATKHINESLRLTFKPHVDFFFFFLRQDLTKCCLAFCVCVEDAHVCASEIRQAEKSNGGRRQGWVLYFPLTFFCWTVLLIWWQCARNEGRSSAPRMESFQRAQRFDC